MIPAPPFTQPTRADILAAAGRLDGAAVRTPLLESDRLNDRLGGRVLLKAECLQRTGSFKFRGAYNFLSRLEDGEKARGVVAYSSGNHAQGVALAARLLGISATIVMPSDAPAIKIANTRSDGAEVVLYERSDGNRAQVARAIVEETGGVLVPPFDHPWIMAGQGTVGLEVADQVAALGIEPDLMIVPTSGGGLVGGCALALEAPYPDLAVHTVEPDGYDDTALSLAAGERVEITPSGPSICDALLLEIPGALTFEVNKNRLAPGYSVSDAEAGAAVARAFHDLKVVLEPSGAAPLAVLLSGKERLDGRTAVLVGSGGNVDPGLFKQLLA